MPQHPSTGNFARRSCSRGAPVQGPGRAVSAHRDGCVASPFAATAMAFAQSAPRDPNIGQAQRTPIWLGYLVAGIFATILVVLTLFPSKRQSEDV